MVTICLVLLNYNGTEDTIDCIESIEKTDHSGINLKVVVIDNNSKNENIINLENYLKENQKYHPDIFDEKSKYFLLKSNLNIGFAAGNNKAIRFAEEYFEVDYYLLLNNDTILEKNSITELLKGFSEENVGAASGLIIENSTKSKVWYAGGHISRLRAKGVHYHYGKNYNELNLKKQNTRFLSGCYVMFKREALINIQLLNERYFFGTEEYDYSIKLTKFGYRLKFVPDSKIYHKVKIMDGNGSSHNIRDLIYVYNSMRNKYILTVSNEGYLVAKIWEGLSRLYIKFVLFKRLEKKYNNTIYNNKLKKMLYEYYKGNLNKKFVDNKEFNEVKMELTKKVNV
ncbi:glycosyltransferase family 2 protein [Paenibacillus sp. FSL H3-0469]|uniref:glycosyltransferase family 2 protein n=1 Tax=Paenibacillus sp. FSL H3-0469 TaxID=2954506 RepID=UPI003101B0B4